MPKIPSSTVIVAYDITNNEIRNELRDYLISTLKAKEISESVYEFDRKKITLKLATIVHGIESILDKNVENEVTIWYLEKNKISLEYEIFKISL